jgi:hypothetical protein
MFELNYPNNINVQKVEDSFVCSVDNFYKNPDEVVKYIESHEAGVHKKDQQPSFNNIHFSDLRHQIQNGEIEKVYRFVEGQFNCVTNHSLDAEHMYSTIFTNKTLWYDNDFNNFEDNYWWPHTDGHVGQLTALVYFDCSGTNLYEVVAEEKHKKAEMMPEHYAPWRPREDYKLLHRIEAKYNRFVIFHSHFYHGAAVWDNTYFKKYRLNQVFFMKQNG